MGDDDGVRFEFNFFGMVGLIFAIVAARWLWLLAEKVLR